MNLRSSQVWRADRRRHHADPPMIIIGGILQENPFFVSPDEFLRELRERHITRNASRSSAV